MIDYSQTQVGDILKIVGAGAPGYAALDELVRVVEVHLNSVWVENRDGERAEFMYNCGAARLEPTEWKTDFPTVVLKLTPPARGEKPSHEYLEYMKSPASF